MVEEMFVYTMGGERLALTEARKRFSGHVEGEAYIASGVSVGTNRWSLAIAGALWGVRCVGHAATGGDCKRNPSGLDPAHIVELLLNHAAVTTHLGIAPGCNGSIVKNSSKCLLGCLDVLRGLELLLDFAAEP